MRYYETDTDVLFSVSDVGRVERWDGSDWLHMTGNARDHLLRKIGSGDAFQTHHFMCLGPRGHTGDCQLGAPCIVEVPRG